MNLFMRVYICTQCVVVIIKCSPTLLSVHLCVCVYMWQLCADIMAVYHYIFQQRAANKKYEAVSSLFPKVIDNGNDLNIAHLCIQ